ncbi:MAG: hypothetical protein ACYCSN_08870 [Acidobacteriaceae bacterium]
MRPQPEEVLKLAERIVSIKRELAAAESEWNAFFPDATNPVAALNGKPGVRGKSSVGRILALLKTHPNVSFAPKEIADTLDIRLGTTRTSLSKLVQGGHIEKRGPGTYGAIGGRQEVLNMAP